MFQKLVSRNDDLRRLVEKGYAVDFDDGYLIVRDIPYLDDKGQVASGAFVTKLVYITADTVEQQDHQVFFAGSHPHDLAGNAIANLGDRPAVLTLSESNKDVIVQRSFSNKPLRNGVLGPYSDFFAKIESYTTIVSGPAIAKFGISPYTFRSSESSEGSVFKFCDTMTSRAEIKDLSAQFSSDTVVVIGLGGTGAYLLDFLVKTPVKEIRAYDFDVFHVHTAFRSPGRLDEAELGTSKADVYRARYQGFREGLCIEKKMVDATSSDLVEGATFAFVCVDSGSSRAEIFRLLLEKKIPFIDVGLGLSRKQNLLSGMMRTTYFSEENGQSLASKDLVQVVDHPNHEYRTNVQIAELNALNASLAIIKFKQLRGFYVEESPSNHLLFNIGDLRMVSEDL